MRWVSKARALITASLNQLNYILQPSLRGSRWPQVGSVTALIRASPLVKGFTNFSHITHWSSQVKGSYPHEPGFWF